ncbi:metal-dependent hydrolase [Natronoarchaeum rubrum]|uniref:metal-dependent hydrolase n=1 Tax=Natronoarchaeum rubrum TaxID=755311 RepID=UPI0021127BFC|nr:metal-dependent hydrolase [Natronoarchaeum rubrum]
MWPWGHAAVGYLLYAAIARGRTDSRPASGAAVWLALGTQAPDLVDKPLAWTAGVLPTGRTLAHALPIVLPFLAATYALAGRRGHTEWAFAFGLGYLAHVFADAVPSLAWGDPAYARFLLWPLLSVPPYDETQSFLAHLTGIDLTGYFTAQLVLTAIAAAVWWRDGLPGLDVLVAAWQRLGAAVT